MGTCAPRGGIPLVPVKLPFLDSVHLSNMSRSFRRLHSPSQLLTFSVSDVWELDKNATVQFMVKDIDLGQTPLRTKVTLQFWHRSPWYLYRPALPLLSPWANNTPYYLWSSVSSIVTPLYCHLAYLYVFHLVHRANRKTLKLRETMCIAFSWFPSLKTRLDNNEIILVWPDELMLISH